MAAMEPSAPSSWSRSISKTRPRPPNMGGSADAGAGEGPLSFSAGASTPLPALVKKVLKLSDDEILSLYHYAQNEAAREADWRGIARAEEPRGDYVAFLKTLERRSASRSHPAQEASGVEAVGVCCQP
ncbi:unnamed protein product [Durusdinium trenchii]